MKRPTRVGMIGTGNMGITAGIAGLALLGRLGLNRDAVSSQAYDLIMSVGKERYLALSYSLINAIQNGKNPAPDSTDTVEAHMIVDAAYESAN